MDMAEKAAGEAVTYAFDFTDELDSGETLTGSATISRYESGAASTGVTVGTPTVSSPRVTALVSGGTAGKVYVLSCSCGTSGGQTLVVEGGVSITP